MGCHSTKSAELNGSFRPVGEIASAFIDRIEANARRQKAGNQLIDAALNCGADAVRFIEILHAELCPGHPIPNPYRLLPEAREWAQWADQAEREAYMLACFEASPQGRQAAFLRHVSGQVAA